jgi:beta-1,4-mannosyl-glycoprotein beta-1,4-N-acetylglucosaminyltransferase
MPKLVDCFTFFNELTMLDFRLEYLAPHVDYFVIVEATRTFSGKSKPLFFQDNRERYARYWDKIVHVVVDDMPDPIPDVWQPEKHQRDCIVRGTDVLALSPDDCIILGDVDEIPDVELIDMRGIQNSTLLQQAMYYYDLHTRLRAPWTRAKIMPYSVFMKASPEDHRRDYSGTYIARGGWHFSYFGGHDAIKTKIQSFSHQEFNTPEILANIEQHIKNGDDLFGRSGGFDRLATHDTYLPKNIENYFQ